MLLDSNIVIYASRLAAAERDRIRAFLGAHGGRPFFVSEISRVEVFGFHALTPEDQAVLERVYSTTTELPVSPALDLASALRRRRRGMKTVDAIIAATALHHGLPLVTHNTLDFRWIEGLELIDPLSEVQ